MGPFLLDTSFLDVVWWMIIVFAWTIFLWMFISTFADIFRRRDMSGVSKVLWILLILVLPIIGILIYIAMRPADATREQDLANFVGMGASPADEIARAQALLSAGTITQEEFDQLKRRALGT
jgi:uncharacterized membrane protein YoaK (UPF0700 family)